MGAIRSALGILASHVTALDDRPRQIFQVALRNSDRLLTLVNDLLDLEQFESGHMPLNLAPVHPASVLTVACDAMQPVTYEAGIHMRVDAQAPDVCADAGRLEQVLVNLITNAIKFSPRDSTVTLMAEGPHPDGPPMVTFTVADEGRGIPADKLVRVFDRFEQVMPGDATERRGAGLGLAICKAIVTQHGGRIWVESEPGVGSHFRFTIPAAVS